MTDFTDPEFVHQVEMDSTEPEQFYPYRVPTHYRIRYHNRWHRVYSKKFGKAYIVFANHELFLDDATLKRLADLLPTAPVVNREQEELSKPDRAPEEREGMTRGYLPSTEADDDIPF